MILVSAYCAVLLSFASGLLALLMNQRQTLLAVSQYCFKKLFIGDMRYQDWINNRLEEQQFPVFLRQAVFALLGQSDTSKILRQKNKSLLDSAGQAGRMHAGL